MRPIFNALAVTLLATTAHAGAVGGPNFLGSFGPAPASAPAPAPASTQPTYTYSYDYSPMGGGANVAKHEFQSDFRMDAVLPNDPNTRCRAISAYVGFSDAELVYAEEMAREVAYRQVARWTDSPFFDIKVRTKIGAPMRSGTEITRVPCTGNRRDGTVGLKSRRVTVEYVEIALVVDLEVYRTPPRVPTVHAPSSTATVQDLVAWQNANRMVLDGSTRFLRERSSFRDRQRARQDHSGYTTLQIDAADIFLGFTLGDSITNYVYADQRNVFGVTETGYEYSVTSGGYSRSNIQIHWDNVTSL